MAVRVVHGANAGFFNLDGISVGAVRRSLREVFNIANDAAAFIDGECVSNERIIISGESLEFVNENGFKGIGALLTPVELKERLQIEASEYDELLILGLPVLRFGTGAVRHPEAAVDEFFRILGDRERSQPPDLVGTPYIAGRLGCTTVWVTEMVRNGEIPPNCVVPGTGTGKPWKFFRVRIDEWLIRR